MGTNASATSASCTFIMNMTVNVTMSKMMTRNKGTSCSDTKFLTISTSEVERWMRSPVLFCE